MIRRPPRSTRVRSSAASDVYKRQVLDRDPAAPPLKWHRSPPIFGPYLLRSNGCIDQDATWYGGRPRLKRLCVRWGPRSPSPKRGRGSAPKFPAHVYCGQTAGWIKMALSMEVGLDPVHIVVDGDTAPLPKTGQTPHTKNFRPIFIVAKRLDASRCHLVRR